MWLIYKYVDFAVFSTDARDAIEALRRSVFTASQQVEHHNPNIVCRDAHTLLLFDCPVFAQHQIDYVLQRHSNVEISFESSEVSTSGFTVIFLLKPRMAWFQQSSFARTVILTALYFVVLYHSEAFFEARGREAAA